MMPNITHDTPADTGPDAPARGEHLARQQAIRQIDRRRRFRASAAWSAVGKPISESEIKREIERQAGPAR